MYKKTKNLLTGLEMNIIMRTSDNAFIPMDQANTDYQVYLKWLDGYELTADGWAKTSDGNIPLPADE